MSNLAGRTWSNVGRKLHRRRRTVWSLDTTTWGIVSSRDIPIPLNHATIEQDISITSGCTQLASTSHQLSASYQHESRKGYRRSDFACLVSVKKLTSVFIKDSNIACVSLFSICRNEFFASWTLRKTFIKMSESVWCWLLHVGPMLRRRVKLTMVLKITIWGQVLTTKYIKFVEKFMISCSRD